MSEPAANVKAVVDRYCNDFPSEVRKLTDILETLSHSPAGGVGVLKSLHNEVHRMAGAASCMGFPFVGQELAGIERSIEGAEGFNAEQTTSLIKAVATSVKSIARLSGYVSSQNSQLLRAQLKIPETKRKAAQFRRDRYKALFSSQRVMFADDDLAIRLLMRDILVSAGIGAVETVHNGAELIAEARRFEPTLVITDWHMAPMNGLEVMETIRKGKSSLDPKCPIIFLTSKSSVEEVQLAIRQGANHYLVKPFTSAAVEKAVYQVLNAKAPALEEPDEEEFLL